MISSSIPSLNQSLENLYLLCEREPDETRHICKEAVSKLVLAHERYVVARSLGAVVSWPVMISDEFMCLFNDRKPMAMLVLLITGLSSTLYTEDGGPETQVDVWVKHC